MKNSLLLGIFMIGLLAMSTAGAPLASAGYIFMEELDYVEKSIETGCHWYVSVYYKPDWAPSWSPWIYLYTYISQTYGHCPY